MTKPRVRVPKTAEKGEVIEIKSLVKHRMESGHRKDKDTGKPIPRKIINKFIAKFNGKEFFSINLEPGISADPYLKFPIKVQESGEFEFIWIDDDGSKYTAKKKIEVK